MNLILKQNINSTYKAKDFEINPLNKNLISVGTKLSFQTKDINNRYKEDKIITRKIQLSENIYYIKEENQLFASSTFYIKNSNNEIYKCDSSKKKILECIFKPRAGIINLSISPLGKIVYIDKNYLYSYDSLSKEEIKIELDSSHDNNYTLYIYNENIILKNRKTNENSNTITIYSPKLKKISQILSANNNIFLKLIGTLLFTTKADGYVEIWDASTEEIYDYKNISKSKITYIANDDEWFYFGNSSGEIIITSDKFKIINTIQLFKCEIKKIIYNDDTLYVLSENGEIATLEVIDDDNKSVVSKFMKTYNIHTDYVDFFTTERVILIENFIKKLNMNKISYWPNEKLIFKALETPISNKKVCILGKDPYHQPNVATGLAFEVRKKSWGEKSINTSLKNILKLLYFSYTNELKEIDAIRKDIDQGKFKILPPDKLFKSWENQGVLLLNTALTVISGEAGSHHKFWNQIITKLITYIAMKNPEIIFILWGNDAKNFEKYMLNSKTIKHNHPAISGNLENPNDFLNGKSFTQTKNIINWLGGKNE